MPRLTRKQWLAFSGSELFSQSEDRNPLPRRRGPGAGLGGNLPHPVSKVFANRECYYRTFRVRTYLKHGIVRNHHEIRNSGGSFHEAFAPRVSNVEKVLAATGEVDPNTAAAQPNSGVQ